VVVWLCQLVKKIMNGSPQIQSSTAVVPRILFVTPRLRSGGAESHIVSVAKSLQNNFNVEVHLAVLLPRDSGDSDRCELKNVHWVGRSSGNSSGVRALSSVVHLKRLIKEIKPRYVYSCLEWSNIAVGICRVLARFSWVAGIQNPLGSRKYLKRTIVTVPRTLLHDQLLRFASEVVVPTVGLAKELRSGLKTAKSVSVVANSVGWFLSEDDMEQTESDFDVVHLGFCGRLVAQKNIFAQLRLVERLSADNDVVLHIVGSGELDAPLKEFCSKRGLSGKVIFYGQLTDPWKILSRIDIFLMTSYFEGFGNVIVEAMRQGKPVVAFDADYGPSEIVKDRETGFLVPNGDEIALELAVRHLVENKALRQEFSKNSKLVAKKYDPIAIASEFYHFVEQRP